MPRDLVFNEASVDATQLAEDVAVWLCDIAAAMAVLVDSGCISKVLRTHETFAQSLLAREQTLFEAIQKMREIQRERATFFMSLAQSSPLLHGLPIDVTGQFQNCQPSGRFAANGEGLMLCALIDGVAVSLPAEAVFDADAIQFEYDRINDETNIIPHEVAIDNIARAHHAQAVIDRDNIRVRNALSVANLWEQRHIAFPNLKFGQDVEGHIATFNDTTIQPILGRLFDLEASAAAWKLERSDKPGWRCNVSGESRSVKQNDKLWDERRFRSEDGTTHYFEHHAKIGSRRIHLRFDRATFLVEIGYIGLHLPTRNDPT